MSENNNFNAGQQGNASDTNTKNKGCSLTLGIIISVLIVGLICAGIGAVFSNCTKKDEKAEESTFESAVTYLDNKINLSGYTDTEKNESSSIWYNSPAVDYPAPTTPLMLEGNAKYVAGVTTVKDLIKAGYKPDDESPVYIAGNKSKSVELRYNNNNVNKKLLISAENNKNTEQKTADCLVSRLNFYPGTGEISFDYLTLNNSSTLNDMIEALGKPNGTRGYPAVTVRKLSNGKTNYSFCYHYKGNIMINVDMNYFSGDNQTSMEKVTVSINR